MLAPGSTDVPPPSGAAPIPTRTATPDASCDSEVAQTVSQTPTPAADQEETITNSIGMEFVLIPAGEFEMGSPSDEEGMWDNEGPVHRVTIRKAFYMGRYEVTQEQWREVMGATSRVSSVTTSFLQVLYFALDFMAGDLSRFKGDNRPVERVSWDDVQEFIRKLNEKEGTDKYRLPSEAEWEYACRAGTTTRYSFGDSESKLGDYAWYRDNSGDKTHLVGQKKPNPYGLYDMHGNVWELVQDEWHSGYNGMPTDGSAWESGSGANRVGRGGDWSISARFCRSACRNYGDPGIRDRSVGFRLLEET
ncbi:MAG: formylglycine-generating enzyme family protein [Methanosarcinales archaeon]|nr:MAG: formylglycine-generating enzyme family protein [Methanosarcinales archaeon]